jgi:hypothetical protein
MSPKTACHSIVPPHQPLPSPHQPLPSSHQTIRTLTRLDATGAEQPPPPPPPPPAATFQAGQMAPVHRPGPRKTDRQTDRHADRHTDRQEGGWGGCLPPAQPQWPRLRLSPLCISAPPARPAASAARTKTRRLAPRRVLPRMHVHALYATHYARIGGYIYIYIYINIYIYIYI